MLVTSNSNTHRDRNPSPSLPSLGSFALPLLNSDISRGIIAPAIIPKQLLVALAAHLDKLFGVPEIRRPDLLGRRVGFRLLGVLGVNLEVSLALTQSDSVRDVHLIDGSQQGALALDTAALDIEARDPGHEPVGAVVGILGVIGREPRVGQALVDVKALLRVDDEHAVDQVEGRVADRVPIRGRVVEPAGLDLLRQGVGELLAVELVGEGWEAAEADVKHDA